MDISEIIMLISLVSINGGLVITAWINTQLKIKEIDIRLDNMENTITKNLVDLKNHKFDTLNRFEKERTLSDLRYEKGELDNKNSHDKISEKLEVLIQCFNDFRVYFEKNK